jgi:hypothetical protein
MAAKQGVKHKVFCGSMCTRELPNRFVHRNVWLGVSAENQLICSAHSTSIGLCLKFRRL